MRLVIVADDVRCDCRSLSLTEAAAPGNDDSTDVAETEAEDATVRPRTFHTTQGLSTRVWKVLGQTQQEQQKQL